MNGRRLVGRTALVTGAAQGLGAAIARRLADEGAWVACLDRDRAGALEVARDLPDGGAGFGGDVGDESRISEVVGEVLAARGGIDVLVNNAGIAGPQTPVDRTDLAGWEETLRVNLTGAFVVSKHTLPHLRRARGCVVNIASALAFIGWTDESAYGPSKAALVQLTKGMALDYAPDVRVNAVCPGAIRTPMIESVLPPGEKEERLVEYGKIHPLHGRLAEPGEIADAVLFLASEDASFITGAALCVDGGLVAS